MNKMATRINKCCFVCYYSTIRPVGDFIEDSKGQRGLRTFIGVDLPDALKGVLASLLDELKIQQLKQVERENLHVTMLFLGDITTEKINYVKELLSGISHKQFKISINELGVFSPNRPHVLFACIKEGADELRSIYKVLYDGLKSNRFALEDRPYTPHITLARIKWLDADSKKRLFEFIDAHKEQFGEFYCNNLALKQSSLTEKGPIYRNIFEKRLLP